MRATFHGGPCDGGDLMLSEPIPQTIRLPLTLPEALHMLEEHPADALPIPNHVPATYQLMLDRPDAPHRDRRGRVIYRYLTTAVPTPPKEDHA